MLIDILTLYSIHALCVSNIYTSCAVMDQGGLTTRGHQQTNPGFEEPSCVCPAHAGLYMITNIIQIKLKGRKFYQHLVEQICGDVFHRCLLTDKSIELEDDQTLDSISRGVLVVGSML